jgi:hypothetical protein
MNQEAFEDFWYFINERHQIYLNKTAGKEWPWTDNYDMQEWKFCNVFRQLDKQSAWLIDNIINLHIDDDQSLLLFNIFLFRAFNLYTTYEAIVSNTMLSNWVDKWNPESVNDIVCQLNPFSSGAYMLRGRQGMSKPESIVWTLTEIWNTKESLLQQIKEAGTLQSTVQIIVNRRYFGWGGFTAYQVALDLTYSSILPNPPDINTWCEFGPGAERGIRHIYPDIKTNEMLQATIDLLKESPNYLKEHVPPMNLQDIEWGLCELSKYIRIKYGGRGKQYYVRT